MKYLYFCNNTEQCGAESDRDSPLTEQEVPESCPECGSGITAQASVYECECGSLEAHNLDEIVSSRGTSDSEFRHNNGCDA